MMGDDTTRIKSTPNLIEDKPSVGNSCVRDAKTKSSRPREHQSSNDLWVGKMTTRRPEEELDNGTLAAFFGAFSLSSHTHGREETNNTRTKKRRANILPMISEFTQIGGWGHIPGIYTYQGNPGQLTRESLVISQNHLRLIEASMRHKVRQNPWQLGSGHPA